MRAVSLMDVKCQEAAIRDRRRVVCKCAAEEDGTPGMGGTMPRKYYRAVVCGHMSVNEQGSCSALDDLLGEWDFRCI